MDESISGGQVSGRSIMTARKKKDTMILEETSHLLSDLYWITLLAVIVSSASGVLKAGVKQFDLFGVIIIAVAASLGGGSLRDMLLNRPVFWVQDQIFFIASIASAALMFFIARVFKISHKHFLIADAAGLTTFGVAGTLVALIAGVPPLIASFMGVMTGTMGGVFRDILCNEQPVIFSSPLYATVSWIGSLIFIGLMYLNIDVTASAMISGVGIFVSRLLSIYYNISLPKFRFKS